MLIQSSDYDVMGFPLPEGAKGPHDSYNSFMTSQGHSVNDGVVHLGVNVPRKKQRRLELYSF